MKTFLKPITFLLLIILLAACAAPTDTAESPTSDDVAQATETSSTASTNAPASDKIRLGNDYADALPASTQMIIGLLKLEETDLAIDEALAAKTLPLWQAYQALSNSDTTAEAELQAVVNQLQGAMSPEQIQAIAALQLTAESAQQMMQEQGIGFGRGGNREGGEMVPDGGGSGVAGLRPGGGGQGGLPGGGPSQLDPEARATAIAERFGGENAGAFLERGLLNALIRNLQMKVGEADPAAQQPLSGRFAARFLEPVSEASGVAVETMQAGLDEGKSFAQVITENSGDMDAAKEALRALFADRGLDAEELEQRIDQIMNGGDE